MEIYKFLSKTHRDAHHERSRHEWQMLTSVSTVYVAVVAGALTSSKVRLPQQGYIWFLSALIAMAVLGFLLRCHIADVQNLDIAEWAEKCLIALVKNRDDTQCKGPRMQLDENIRFFGICWLWHDLRGTQRFSSYFLLQGLVFVSIVIVATYLLTHAR